MRLSRRSLEESVGKPLYLIFRYVPGYFLNKSELSRLLPEGEPCGSNSAQQTIGLIPESASCFVLPYLVFCLVERPKIQENHSSFVGACGPRVTPVCWVLTPLLLHVPLGVPCVQSGERVPRTAGFPCELPVPVSREPVRGMPRNVTISCALLPKEPLPDAGR